MNRVKQQLQLSLHKIQNWADENGFKEQGTLGIKNGPVSKFNEIGK